MLTKTETLCAKIAYDKLKAGKQITAREQEILERHELYKTQKEPPERLMATFSEFAEIIGVKLRAIPKLVKAGLPVRGDYVYLPDAIQWWARRSGHDLKASQAQYWRAKEQAMAMRIKQARRELVAKRDVLAAVDEAVKLLATHLTRLPKRLEPVIGRQQADEIDVELRKLLDGVVEAAKNA